MAASIKSILTIGGQNYLLNTCTYSFNQSVDNLGRARAGVRSGLVEFTILGNEEAVIQHWAIDPKKMYDGEIVFFDIDNRQFKKLEFKKAYCVHYVETFVPSGGSISYQFEVGLTASQLIINGIMHDNQWSNLKDTY
jgi:hypothetical protein